MLLIFHWLLITLFVTIPVMALMHSLHQGARGKFAAVSATMSTISIGAMVGIVLTVLWAESMRSRASFGQYLLAIYFSVAMLLVLKALDSLLRRGLRFLVRRARLSTVGWAAALAMAIRAVLLIGLGLPLVLAGAMVYRPRLLPRVDPFTSFETTVTVVRFDSTDGVRLAGWWMPAQDSGSRRRADSGAKTVLLCDGLGTSRSAQFNLARKLLAAGYNVLAFDFRASGQSATQMTSFGDLERRDVLGAVRWIREQHAAQARRIVGVGASTGAAALIAAAADPSAEGQAIQAIAVFGGFDSFTTLSRDSASAVFLPPMDWLTSRLSVPLASALVGTNLTAFSPARLTEQLWPRPILVIHATYDPIIPFDRGRDLFDAATFPKQQLWITNQDQNGALRDNEAAGTVIDFFDHAKAMQVI